MTATALGLVLAAAVLHAAWNLLAKRAGGGAALVWLYGSVSAALLTPPVVGLLVLHRTDFETTGLAYTVTSSVLHVAYFLVLQRGHEHGDLLRSGRAGEETWRCGARLGGFPTGA